MKAFRFRGAAALEVRCREERAAEAVLARAEADFTASDRAWTSASREIGLAAAALESTSRAGISADAISWHRNWILRLTAVASVRREQRVKAEITAGQARRVWQAARKRRLMLERLRDRALERYRVDEHRQELKDLDELARVRFTTARMEIVEHVEQQRSPNEH